MAYLNPKTTNSAPYAVGNKIYGGGRSFPTSGPVDKLGYRERDATLKARRSAVLRRMKAGQKGNYMSADWQRSV
jgi:hypothetical protein